VASVTTRGSPSRRFRRCLSRPIALYIKWILIGVAIWAVVWLTRRGLRAVTDAKQRRQQQLDAIRARADQQHQWVMAGDDRGVYGEYPSATPL